MFKVNNKNFCLSFFKTISAFVIDDFKQVVSRTLKFNTVQKD